MKSISKVLVIATVAISATAAQAQLYGEVGYMALNIKATEDAETLKANPSMLGLTIGYDVHKNVAIEGMVAFSVRKDGVEFNGEAIPVDVKVNNAYGIFVKPKVMLSENFEVFGRLGYVENKISASGFGETVSETNGDFAYGVGVNYYVNKTMYVTGNYMSVYNKDNTKAGAFTIGLGMKF